MSAAFSFAPAAERTLSLSAYLVGALELALIVVPLGWAAWRLRAALLGGWTGAPGRLVEIVLGLVLLTWVGQAVGTFGGYRVGPMIVGALAVGAATRILAPRLERRTGAGTSPGPASSPAALAAAPQNPGASPSAPGSPPAPPSEPLAFWVGALACAAVAAAWALPTLASLAGGMDRADTLWYHMPLAARFVQTGELGQIFHFDPIFFAAYYPGGSAVFHALGILAFERDFLSPLLNLGFVGLGLLAAWSVGRPFGLGPQAALGGAVALGGYHLVEFQAGEALNDIVGTSLVLAAAAILVNAGAARRAPPLAGDDPPPASGRRAQLASSPVALAAAGLAAGLAAAMKLSFLAPVAALAIGVAVIAGRGARLRGLAWFAVPALLAGGYWYARNLVAIGNPLPYVSWGPLDLPSPERAFELREPFSVAHYLTDFEVISDWFVPGLELSFGSLWPLTLVAMVGAGVLALWRGGEPVIRMLGGVVLVTLVAYVVTPLTAAGEEGEPISFVWNVRYMAPAAAIALAILPCLPDLRRNRTARDLTLVGLAILCAATIFSLIHWEQGHVKGAVGLGVVVLAGFAATAWARGRHPGAPRLRGWAGRGLAWGLAAGALLVALGAGWWEQNHYLERRYENLSPRLRIADAARWARDLRDARVAIAGVRGVFNQYPFYGTDLSNRVQWLGEEGEEGALLRIPTCERWREALNEGEYTHVVTMYDPYDPGVLTDTKEAQWTRLDPASRELVRDGPVSVFELEGPLDPAGCAGLEDLSEAERNGDSVNLEPLANQPLPAPGRRPGGERGGG